MIVFIQKKYLLKDITDFAQYIRNFTYDEKNNKLITIIGELHGKTIDCEENEENEENEESKETKVEKVKEFDIVEYIKNVSKYFNKKIILEYDKYSQPKGISYGNINKIDKEITIESNPNIIKIPIDFRRQYIGVEAQDKLYNSPDIYLYSKDEILRTYVDPFYTNVGEKTKYIKGEENYNELVNILYTDYLPKVGDNFNKIAIYIRDNWDKIDEKNKKITVHNLKVLWAQLGDFYVLREIFKEEDINEYVILIGKGHYYNITKYLNEVLCEPFDKKHIDRIYFQKIIDKSINTINKCIDIKNTAMLIDSTKNEKYKDIRKPIFQMFKTYI